LLFEFDYRQLLRSTARRAQNRQQEIADSSSGIKSLVKELNAPVIVLSQLNQLNCPTFKIRCPTARVRGFCFPG